MRLVERALRSIVDPEVERALPALPIAINAEGFDLWGFGALCASP